MLPKNCVQNTPVFLFLYFFKDFNLFIHETHTHTHTHTDRERERETETEREREAETQAVGCLLYTSDAADD